MEEEAVSFYYNKLRPNETDGDIHKLVVAVKENPAVLVDGIYLLTTLASKRHDLFWLKIFRQMKCPWDQTTLWEAMRTIFWEAMGKSPVVDFLRCNGCPGPATLLIPRLLKSKGFATSDVYSYLRNYSSYWIDIHEGECSGWNGSDFTCQCEKMCVKWVVGTNGIVSPFASKNKIK